MQGKVAVITGGAHGIGRAIAEAFRRELDQLNKTEDRAFNVEASCGAKVFKLNSLSSIEECIQQSDEMMYEQKELHHAHRTE